MSCVPAVPVVEPPIAPPVVPAALEPPPVPVVPAPMPPVVPEVVAEPVPPVVMLEDAPPRFAVSGLGSVAPDPAPLPRPPVEPVPCEPFFVSAITLLLEIFFRINLLLIHLWKTVTFRTETRTLPHPIRSLPSISIERRPIRPPFDSGLTHRKYGVGTAGRFVHIGILCRDEQSEIR